jgi:hypothetical protein
MGAVDLGLRPTPRFPSHRLRRLVHREHRADVMISSTLVSGWTGKFRQLLALENAAGVDAGLTVRAVRLPPQLIRPPAAGHSLVKYIAAIE